MTSVSVVVPTKNRVQALGRCLRALVAQRRAGPFEIVIVDDGSDDAAGVPAIVNRESCAQVVRTAGVGPAAARNAGVRAASGDIVCFTDDDCEPDPDWSEILANAIVAGADVVGGSTRSGRPGDVFIEASELIVRELQQSTRQRLQGLGIFVPTNNLACRRDILLAHPFDESYDQAGGEDRAWCASVSALGLTAVLAPEARIAHTPTLGLGGYWRQHVRYGRGAYRFARTKPTADWQEPWHFYARLLRASLDISLACLALVVVAQFATTFGMVAEGLAGSKRRVTVRAQTRDNR